MTVPLGPSFRLVKCPPAAAHGVLPEEPAFGDRKQMPVSAAVHAGGEFTSLGLSFDNYHFMQTRLRKKHGERRLPTPSWAVNRSEMARLIVRFWELRADLRYPGTGSLKDRLQHAEWIIQNVKRPRWFELLKDLCQRRLATDDPERRRELEVEIRVIDTLLRTADQGPSLVVGVIYFYYSVGHDSVGTGAALGIQPVSVRQLLKRLHATWRRMEDGTDKKPKAEKKKAQKAAITSVT